MCLMVNIKKVVSQNRDHVHLMYCQILKYNYMYTTMSLKSFIFKNCLNRMKQGTVVQVRDVAHGRLVNLLAEVNERQNFPRELALNTLESIFAMLLAKPLLK